MSIHSKNKKCEVCNSANLQQVLDLGNHPLCDDLIVVGDAAKCEEFPVNILFCKNCLTAHQKYQVPKSKLFPRSYHYRSRLTSDVLSGMDELVNSVENNLGALKKQTVLDVGCNDGSLLDKFSKKGAITIGVEPTGACIDASGREHKIFNGYFTKNTALNIMELFPKIDIITFTNVFAHIENLPQLLEVLKMLMSEKTVLVVENHYLGSVLDKNQFDTFYHEHPRTYSLKSFVHIAQKLGREITAVSFPKRYGGNIRVFIGKSGTANLATECQIKDKLLEELQYLEKFEQMQSFILNWKYSKRKELQNIIKSQGRLVAKAFPGRAAILIKLLELSENDIECVYEKPASMKIGHYVPGTKIPICSDDKLFTSLNKIKNILNLAWHIPEEVSTYLCEKGFSGQLINIID